MYSWIAGLMLLLLTLMARADDRSMAAAFPMHPDASLFASEGSASYVVASPDVSLYSNSEDSLRLQQARERQLSTFRDNIYNALGISHLIPRGSFMAGGVKTVWRLNTPNRNTIEFKLEARW